LKKQKKKSASLKEPEAGCLKETPNGVELRLLAQPNSSRTGFEGIQENALKIKITAPPVEGQANKACLKLLSKALGVPQGAMTIKAGQKTRRKTVLITGAAIQEIERRISALLE